MLGLLKRLLGWDTHGGGSRTSPQRGPRSPAGRRTPSKPPQRSAPSRAGGAPGLSLDTQPKDGFDPYNTGVYDRGASWDRISKNSR